MYINPMKISCECGTAYSFKLNACPSCGAQRTEHSGATRDPAAPYGRWGDGSPIPPMAKCEYGPCGKRTQLLALVDGRRTNICEACMTEYRRRRLAGPGPSREHAQALIEKIWNKGAQ